MFVPRSVDRLRPNKDRQTCQASPRRLNTRASRSAPSSVAHPLGRVAPARLPRRCTELPLRRPVVGQNSICTLDVGRQGGEAGRQCTSYSLWALCALRWERARTSFLRTWRYDSNSPCSVAAPSALGFSSFETIASNSCCNRELHARSIAARGLTLEPPGCTPALCFGRKVHPSWLLSGTAPILLHGPPLLDTLPRCSALSWGCWWGSSVRAHRSWQRTSFSDSN